MNFLPHLTNKNEHRNDVLVNTLIKHNFLRTVVVEKALRCVDRGFFNTNTKNINLIYKYNSGWKSGNVFLISPYIDAAALENLCLSPGHKFLNIKCGAGLFNIIAGFLLGTNGVNHGIDSKLTDVATKKLAEYKLNAAAIDQYDFCEPIYINGNVHGLSTANYYDRIYCNVTVSSKDLRCIKSYLKVGGILIIPFDIHLIKFTRTSEHEWKTEPLNVIGMFKSVNFYKEQFEPINFPSFEPLTLKNLCKRKICSLVRINLVQERPVLLMQTNCLYSHYKEIHTEATTDILTQFVCGMCTRFSPSITREKLIKKIDKIESKTDDETFDFNRYPIFFLRMFHESNENHSLIDNSIPVENNDSESEESDTDSSNSENSELTYQNEKIDDIDVNYTLCHFEKDRTKNLFSINLQNIIDTLPLPTPLKIFLKSND